MSAPSPPRPLSGKLRAYPWRATALGCAVFVVYQAFQPLGDIIPAREAKALPLGSALFAIAIVTTLLASGFLAGRETVRHGGAPPIHVSALATRAPRFWSWTAAIWYAIAIAACISGATRMGPPREATMVTYATVLRAIGAMLPHAILGYHAGIEDWLTRARRRRREEITPSRRWGQTGPA